MIARIEVELWAHRERFKADPVSFVKLQELFPNSFIDPVSMYNADAIVELDVVLPVLAELGVEAKVKAFKNTLMVGLRDQIRTLEKDQRLLRQQIAQDGMLVQIHIPNGGLFLVDEVNVLNDCCTDQLQGDLNEGWHILCVCPPNGQRRPDYIMGRKKPQ